MYSGEHLHRWRERVSPTRELNFYQNTRRHIAQDSDHSPISLSLSLCSVGLHALADPDSDISLKT